MSSDSCDYDVRGLLIEMMWTPEFDKSACSTHMWFCFTLSGLPCDTGANGLVLGMAWTALLAAGLALLSKQIVQQNRRDLAFFYLA